MSQFGEIFAGEGSHGRETLYAVANLGGRRTSTRGW
jgi:hypothetical protein